MKRRFCFFWLLILSMAFQPSAAAGQANTGKSIASVRLLTLDGSRFPTVIATIDVRDEQGRFIRDLQPFQVRMLEDERPQPVSELEELQPGALFITALNPGRSFAIRDGQGFSRYDRLSQALQSWAAGQGSASKETRGDTAGEEAQGQDDFNLLITDGPQALHLASAQEWFSALTGYQADLRAADARLDVLVQALEVAAAEPPRAGMGRLILFITPPPEGDFSAGLQAIIARAQQEGIRICVWLVASVEMFTSPGAIHLQELASQTGGAFFAFSGAEPIPNLEDYLAPLRSVYRLTYESRLAASGPHQVAAEISLGGFDLTQASASGEKPVAGGAISSPKILNLTIQPPNLAFVEPPVEIVREGGEVGENGEPILTPLKQDLEVLVEFPDGFPRQLISMTLYADGTPVAVISEPPFNRIAWDLRGYTEDGAHRVRVEATDILGLKNASREIPIQINVKTTPRSLLVLLARQAPLLALMAAVLSGVVLALVLILGGRIRPAQVDHWPGAGSRGLGRYFHHARRRGKVDPLTQPVRGAYPASASSDKASADISKRSLPDAKTEPGPRALPHWMTRLQRHSHRVRPDAHASLARLVDSEQATIPAPIGITSDEVTFGRDPYQATQILDDPSVEPLHARLRLVDGVYRLSDEGTTAGTWVNYTPVSKEGVNLEHGDLVHIGRIGFRFLIREPARVRKPVITREDHST